MEKKRICIVGGGASGLMAAIMAAREGACVTLLEHNERAGKKLLATGNGRCNLTNLDQDPACYHTRTPEAVRSVLDSFSMQQTIAFFSGIGIYTRNKNNCLYPASMQASSVLELLEAEARYQKVKFKYQEHVTAILPGEKETNRFLVKTQTWQYPADAVILACGSFASQIQGADGSGYKIAENLGHRVIKPLPALVPLKGKGTYFSQWAGVRVEGRVSLLADGTVFQQEEGEIQLTEYGVSGIPVFQVSGYAVRLLDEGVPVTLLLDFFPDFDRKGMERLLQMRKEQCPYKTLKELLIGLFPKKLIPVLVQGCTEIEEAAAKIKEFPVQITGAKSLEQAQVCSGGVDLAQINPLTMESRLVPGLYFAGELADADGLCGGYNLQWAWSSGAVAGKHAASYLNCMHSQNASCNDTAG